MFLEHHTWEDKTKVSGCWKDWKAKPEMVTLDTLKVMLARQKKNLMGKCWNVSVLQKWFCILPTKGMVRLWKMSKTCVTA